ncbi:TcpE family conjugal transfer membrane protein [Enterococcus sp. AZ103]|uniref:TcpE family conjugal transfer membrane protein n=1 Tax=Enterococcus sp. AZ103 TaxID=2774628 RepID=UPI003F260288
MPPLNYRTIFKKPIIINSIADFILPFSIELKRALLAVPALLLLWVLNRFVLNYVFPLIHNMTISFIYYGVGVYYLSGWFADEYTVFDNKNLMMFLKNYIKYFTKIKVGNRVLTDNQIITNLEPNIRFSKAKI